MHNIKAALLGNERYANIIKREEGRIMLESGENYLEAIYNLQKENGTVRSIDVAVYLSVTKASVSRAMSILRENGFISFEKRGELILTAKGYEKASEVAVRHAVLKSFLTTVLKVCEEAAEHDACRFEHDISAETFEKIKQFLADYQAD